MLIKKFFHSKNYIRENDFHDEKAKCHLMLCEIYSNNSGYKKALECINIAIEAARKSGNKTLEAECQINRAIIFVNLKDFKQALNSLQECYNIRVRDDDMVSKIKRMYMLSNFYQNLNAV